jgi:Divergent InlB B-repeat domain
MPRIFLVALAAATFAAAPSTALAATTELKVVPVGGGTISVSPAPLNGDNCADPMAPFRGSRAEIPEPCLMTYDVGTRVRIEAAGFAEGDGGFGPATTLDHWSDERCPGTGPCEILLGPDHVSVAALFTPQRVSVLIAGEGSLGGGFFDPDNDVPCATGLPACVADFRYGSVVRLDNLLSGPGTWGQKKAGALLPLCDSEQPPPCDMTMAWPRWAAVGFGVPPNISDTIPAEVSVDFQIRKAGSGSGTVRSESNAFNCGGQCARDRTFGSRETLVADPDSGSRFDHWGSACGSSPRCSLAVGPVTALTAFFERGAGGGAVSQQHQQQSKNPRLAARLLRLNVRGHGRRRTVVIRLRLNAPSTVRAVLLRGRRQVAAKRFHVPAGTHLLRFRVPARARPGSYRMRLIIKGNGQTKQLTQRVRLRR